MDAFKDSNNSLTKDYNKTFNTRNTRTEFDSKYPLSSQYMLIIPVQYCSNKLSCSARGFGTFSLCTVVKQSVYFNFLQCILNQLLLILNMIKYTSICAEYLSEKGTFDDGFSLLEDDQVNAKYVSRATKSRFFVKYVTHTSQLYKKCMH